MSDLLAIVDETGTDEALLDEIVRRHPDRVTVLVEGGEPDWALDESRVSLVIRDRLALLMASIEGQTSAVVVGLAGSREQLQGWRFDRVVGGRAPLTAV
jgi:hypothetical protein